MCEGSESAAGRDWKSGPQPPRAGMEERWGTKRREGEKRVVRRVVR